MLAAWLYATVLMNASEKPATQEPTAHTVKANSMALPGSSLTWSMMMKSI
jgi:hypothetical protein